VPETVGGRPKFLSECKRLLAPTISQTSAQPLRTNLRAYLGMGFLAAAVGLLVLPVCVPQPHLF
jgi:hypothetical protein